MTAQATYQWLTTAPNPSSRPGTPFWNDYDQGQRGWRLHAVEAEESEKFPDIRFRRAACGLLPTHGWDLDLFIERRCLRCAKALGLPLTQTELDGIETRARLRKEWR